jgi:hypothetical protein
MALPEFRLKELADKARDYSYEAADDTLYNDPSRLDDFLHRLEGFPSAIDELQIAGEGASFPLEKKLAIAEALSLSSAVSIFVRRVKRLRHATLPQDLAFAEYWSHATVLRNAFVRYMVIADGVE